MQNIKSVISFKVMPCSSPCAGNEMCEMNVLQMEKVLVIWPEPGLQSLSTNPRACWATKSGIRLHNGCANFKPSGCERFLTLCASTAFRKLDFGWCFIHGIPFAYVCWRHTKGYPWEAAFWGKKPAHVGPHVERSAATGTGWSTQFISHKCSQNV